MTSNDSHVPTEKEQKEMREAQKWFAASIRLCMDGKEKELEATIEDYLRKKPQLTPKDIIIGFKSEGKTLMHLAASSGHLNILELLLKKVPVKSEVCNLVDDKGFTPLINATVSESSSAMNELIKVGAKVNSVTKDGASSLHFAAADGSLERMGILLKNGADLKLMSSSGTPLHWAAGKGNVKAIQYLIGKSAPIESTAQRSIYKGTSVTPAAIMAAVCSCGEAVCDLIKAGAYPAHVISGDVTLLHVCAENNLEEAVAMIVGSEYGASLAVKRTVMGNTPIELAAMHGSREIVARLLPLDPQAGADVEGVLAKGPGLLRVWEDKTREHAEREKAAKGAAGGTKGVFGAEKEQEEVHKAEPIDAAKDDAAKASAEAAKGRGNEHYKAGAFQPALEAYSEAIQLEGDNAIYWSNRSACYLSLNKPRDALVDAEVCRGLRPDWDKACLRLAKARLALGMFEDAAVAAFEGLKLDNSNKTLKELTNQAVKLGKEQHQRDQAERKAEEERRKKDAMR